MYCAKIIGFEIYLSKQPGLPYWAGKTIQDDVSVGRSDKDKIR
jgi:hypothetical protein